MPSGEANTGGGCADGRAGVHLRCERKLDFTAPIIARVVDEAVDQNADDPDVSEELAQFFRMWAEKWGDERVVEGAAGPADASACGEKGSGGGGFTFVDHRLVNRFEAFEDRGAAGVIQLAFEDFGDD